MRFLIPEGGVSALDAPGKPFHDPAADAALFERARGAASARPPAPGTHPSGPPLQRPPAIVDASMAALRTSCRGHREDARRHGEDSNVAKLLAKFRAMTAAGNRSSGAARHRPQCQMRGGGRDRPDRDLQFGPVSHGRPRLARRSDALWQCQRDRGHGNGARGAPGGPQHPRSGRRQRHRPLLEMEQLPGPVWMASGSRGCRTSRPSA